MREVAALLALAVVVWACLVMPAGRLLFSM
jgi:hypothetical protein